MYASNNDASKEMKKKKGIKKWTDPVIRDFSIYLSVTNRTGRQKSARICSFEQY